jgi:arylsulfatase A-like enzyme
VHRGGGLGQPSDEPGGRSYFNPIVFRDGEPTRTQGYCTDVFTDAALDFLASVSRSPEQPFFLMVAYNAPHTPLEAMGADLARYRGLGLDPTTERLYAMIANIDDNVGRLLEQLERSKIANDTIVVFLTDNGPQQPRFNAGLRGLKGSPYEGGIRVPCFIRWPGRIAAGSEVDAIAGAIDLAPTLYEACGASPDPDHHLDGQSLLGGLVDRGNPSKSPRDFGDRTIFAQWHRGDAPSPRHAFAAVTDRYKLVQPTWPDLGKPHLELYDLRADPGEMHNIADRDPHVVNDLLARYDRWFADVSRQGASFEPVRIWVGSDREPLVTLTRQDWRGPRAAHQQNPLGGWEIQVVAAGRYQVVACFDPAPTARGLSLRLDETVWFRTIGAEVREVTFDGLPMPAGPHRLEAVIDDNGETSGPDRVIVRPSDGR